MTTDEIRHAIVTAPVGSPLPDLAPAIASADHAKEQHGKLCSDPAYGLLFLTRDAIGAVLNPGFDSVEEWLESLYGADAPAIWARLGGKSKKELIALETALESEIDARGRELLGDKYIPFAARFIRL